MKITRESWVIAALGIADLITTIIFIEHHGAEEANPLFKHLWEMGLIVFVMAKLILLACPLCVLEWARRRNPRFTIRALRGAIAGYIILYGIGFARLNGPAAEAREIHAVSPAETVQYSVPNPAEVAGWASHYAHLTSMEMAQSGQARRAEQRRRFAQRHLVFYRDTGKLAGLRVPHLSLFDDPRSAR